ncbi:MAG: hypothetical protein GY789_18555 [Hyphomicrobiales bacterium]|nr:hypothetical protein [Hyphomicrobiales bacterium]MCP5000240.1 hypothetical protein [Hyphomicrobiales bacterium]
MARDLGRYLYILVKYLRLTGYETTLRGQNDLAARMREKRWANRLLEDDGVHLKSRSQPAGRAEHGPNDILVHDGDDAAGYFAGLKQFRLVKGRRLTLQPTSYDVLFPYMLHPKYYADGRYLNIAKYRAKNRNIGLFFSGNYNDRYRDPSILAKYGKLQRTALLEMLLDGLSSEQIFRTGADMESELATGRLEKKFVFADNLGGFRVAKGRWLETLGHCQFFLACPGVDMPLSHNLVEAMSVGCIPLTQYGDYFDPPMRDGRECVSHNGSDIVAKAQSVLAMDASEIEALRTHVIAYYERYLSVDAFRRRVLEYPGRQVRLGMNFMPVQGAT